MSKFLNNLATIFELALAIMNCIAKDYMKMMLWIIILAQDIEIRKLLKEGK